MEDAGSGFSMAVFVIPGVILTLFIMVIALFRFIAQNYITVPPNEVAVLSGKKSGENSYKIYTGGAFFRIPIIQRVDYLSLNVMTFSVAVVDVPDKNGVLTSVRGVANVKIQSEEGLIQRAVERFLGMERSQIENVAKENLEGNLRAIVGKMDIEGLIGDRESFQGQVLTGASTDMLKLGMTIDLLNIQEITDGKGYIQALGRKRTSEVVRDAEIGEADAQRDSAVKSASAKQEGSIAKAKADEEISNAERKRDMAMAQNRAQVEAEEARIPLAAEKAQAEVQKEVNVAQVAAEQARTEAEIDLQEAKRRRREAELNATTVVEATKDKEARVIKAEGEQQAATLEGEASRIRAEKEGLGDQVRQTAQAEGRKATAAAKQAELEAEAAGRKAALLAEASGTEAMLLAEAKGVEARGLAEAAAAEAKAEAFGHLEAAGKLLMVLEALPTVVNAIGGAAEKIVVPAAQAIGTGLGNVKEIRLIDLGGNTTNGGKGNVLSQFMAAPPETLFGLVEKLNASGMMPAVAGLLNKAGIDLSSLMGDMGPVQDAKVVGDTPDATREPVPEEPAVGKIDES